MLASQISSFKGCHVSEGVPDVSHKGFVELGIVVGRENVVILLQRLSISTETSETFVRLLSFVKPMIIFRSEPKICHKEIM